MIINLEWVNNRINLAYRIVVVGMGPAMMKSGLNLIHKIKNLKKGTILKIGPLLRTLEINLRGRWKVVYTGKPELFTL